MVEADHSKGRTPLTNRAPLVVPARIDDYEILGEVGRGGMGVIFKARHSGLNRLTAIKMLHGGGLSGGMAGSDALKAEAAAAASLDHPNIVGIYDIGVYGEDVYFSMEFISGEDLNHFSLKNILDSEKVAELVLKVANALSYAHSKGVMHHDLKPANVLIDSDGQPQITDFGLACRIDEANRRDPTLGYGTPNYLSPEQASARFGEPGVATDVFGIGGILYFLLTDSPPFRGVSAADTIAAVLTMDPVGPRTLRPGIPIELETICLKCLEKNPARRYASMKEVAEELNRFLKHEPIKARPAGLLERSLKWRKRHPVIATLLMVIVLLLLMVGFGASVAAFRINQARQKAELSDMEARRNLYDADMLLASQAFSAGNESMVRTILSRHLPSAGRLDTRGWEWYFLWQASQGDMDRPIGKHRAAVAQIEFTRDGKQVIAGDSSGMLKVWDYPSQAPVERGSKSIRPLGAPPFVQSQDSKSLLTTSRDSGGTNTLVHWLTLPTLDSAAQFQLSRAAIPVGFDRDNKHAWFLGSGFLTKNGIPDGGEIVRFPLRWDGLRRDYKMSGNGRFLAVGDELGGIGIFEIATGRMLRKWPAHEVRPVWGAAINWLSFTSDDRSLVSAGSDGGVRVWDVASGKLLRNIPGHSDLVMSAVFSPDGQTVLSAGKDSFIQLQSLTEGAFPKRMRGAQSLQTVATFVPGTALPVTGGLDGEIHQWLASPRSRFQWITNLPAGRAAVSILHGGKFLAVVGGDKGASIHRVSDGGLVVHLEGNDSRLGGGLGQIGEGRFICASIESAGELRVIEYPSKRQRVAHIKTSSLGPRQLSTSVDIPSDGKTLLLSDLVDGVRAYDFETLNMLYHLDLKPRVLSLSSHNTRIAVAEITGQIHILDLRTGKELVVTDQHPQISNVEFSPDDSMFASVSYDGSLRLWNTATGKEVHRYTSAVDNLFSIAWMNNGTRLFCGTLSGNVVVWDLITGRETLVQKTHSEPVTSLSLLEDGTLLSAGPDGLCKWLMR